MMLYRKGMPRICSLCRSAQPVSRGQFLCSRRGVVDAQYGCMRFCYDPLRRVPSEKVKPTAVFDFTTEDKA